MDNILLAVSDIGWALVVLICMTFCGAFFTGFISISIVIFGKFRESLRNGREEIVLLTVLLIVYMFLSVWVLKISSNIIKYGML